MMVRLAPRELEKVNYSKSLKESCLNTVADLHTKFLIYPLQVLIDILKFHPKTR